MAVITGAILIFFALTYFYLMPQSQQQEKQTTNNEINIIKNSNISKNNLTEIPLETTQTTQSVEFSKEITIDCLIGSEDLCYAEGDTEKGWMVGALDKKLVDELKKKYKTSDDVIEIVNLSIINNNGNKLIVDNEDIKVIQKSILEFSAKIREKGQDELNTKVAKFEFITLKKEKGKWFWQYAVSEIGTNFPNGDKRVLLNFNLSD